MSEVKETVSKASFEALVNDYTELQAAIKEMAELLKLRHIPLPPLAQQWLLKQNEPNTNMVVLREDVKSIYQQRQNELAYASHRRRAGQS